ncbi:MAG: hypothetical protein LH606_16705 [Cytophagaceae bacterium]|nr:hypothetical protein [Cytophagaceae bacterium]
MVKIGFICEGETEKLIVESPVFQNLISEFGLVCIDDVIDAGGNGNLLPQNIEQFQLRLLNLGAQKIFILTDLDVNSCITLTRTRITERPDQIIIVSVKQIESWFLADSFALNLICQTDFSFCRHEQELNPFETIRQQLFDLTGRGIHKRSKLILAKRFLNAGFSIRNAAAHPNCPSARYFLNKLTEFAQ